jgi:hypothetical protein
LSADDDARDHQGDSERYCENWSNHDCSPSNAL